MEYAALKNVAFTSHFTQAITRSFFRTDYNAPITIRTRGAGTESRCIVDPVSIVTKKWFAKCYANREPKRNGEDYDRPVSSLCIRNVLDN